MVNTLSLSPDDFVVGGGLLEDADVEIQKARFVYWDYNKTREETPALQVSLINQLDGEKSDSYYSVGDKAVYSPDANTEGRTLKAESKIKKNSNVALFLQSLVDAGFPKSKLIPGDMSVLDGVKVHMTRKEAPKRPGLKSDTEREKTVLLVTKILSMPGEGMATSAVSSDLASEAEGLILTILSDGPVAKKDLISKVFEKVKTADAPKRNGIIKLVGDDSFLKSSHPWKLEGGILSL